ncbi:MAG: helix-turn-helix domain-containing protein, partial [Alteromonas sp.]
AHLSNRFEERRFSPKQFNLTMTRNEIGNYLGLTVETISRLLTRFQNKGIIAVEGKLITILDFDLMEDKLHSADIPTSSVS